MGRMTTTATTRATTPVLTGDVDPASLAPIFGDPSRLRVLAALMDGRSLPASVLAAEAGISPQAMSAHLAKLLEARMVAVERSGRHRYYRLADDRVAAVIEAMLQLAPRRPVTSMTAGTRAAALREARSCYDHLAGRLGVALTQRLVGSGVLVPADGRTDLARRPDEPLSAPLGESVYRLGPCAEEELARLGVDLPGVRRQRRPLLRFCLDWSEQRHHVSGALGAALLDAALARDWVRRREGQRALTVTDAGREALPVSGTVAPDRPLR